MKFKGILRLRWLLVGLLAAVLLGAAACGDDEEEVTGPTQFDGVIKIGQVVDESGFAGGSPIALSFKPGMEAAMRDINAKGGVKVGGKRYELKLISRDTRSEAVVAVAAAQDLIREGVIAVDIDSALFFSQVYGQLNPANIISFMVNPTGLNLLEFEGPQKHPLLFSTIELATPIIVGWAEQINQLTGGKIKRAGYIYQDDPLGQSMLQANKDAAKKVGWEFVGSQAAPIGTTDWSVFITNLKAAKPDIVYQYGAGGQVQLAIQSVQLDLAPFLEVPGFVAKHMTLVPIGDKTVFSVDWRFPFYPGLTPAQYVEAVNGLGTTAAGFLQTGFAISYHDFIHLLAQAIEKAGTVTDTKAIAKALVGQVYDGPFGKAVMTEGQTTIGPTGLIVTTKDKFKVYIYDKIGDLKEQSSFEAPLTAAR